MAEVKNFNETEEQKKLIGMTRDEYDSFMCKRFPEFFVNRSKSMQESCMYWGFDIGNGWFPVLYELCGKLEEICKPNKIPFAFDQIKEKYGGARFYYTCDVEQETTADDAIYKLVSDYENICDHICANCGGYYTKKTTLRGWIYDACEECLKKPVHNE